MVDFSFLDKLSLNAYVVDKELNLLFVNQFAANRRCEDQDKFFGQSVFNCHKKGESELKIINMRDEFARGRREPFNYSLREGDRLFCKVILPFYEGDEFKGMFEISYFDSKE